MNNYSARAHPEKFIPKVVKSILEDVLVPIHSHPDKIRPGSRYWIHSRNVADGILFLINNVLPKYKLEGKKLRDKFNIIGERELDNLELALLIADIIGKPLKYEMSDYHSSRPFHDLHYRLDGSKMKELGWSPPVAFEASLEKTIRWMIEEKNKRWLYI
jgi:dTDP-glucose 4,6-dehydratase